MAEEGIAARRWLAKKGARMAVGGCGTVLGRLRRSQGPRLRVLTYHRFGETRRMPFTVAQDAFEAEMAYLAASRRAVSLDDVEAFIEGRRSLADGSVLVTIDDGDPSVHRIALPILKRHGVPAVLYAIAGRPDGFETMTDEELRELHREGVAIGSHSVTHRSLGRMPVEEAGREVRDSKARLEDVLGAPVTSFAYPFGTRVDVSPAVAAELAEAGYRTAFTSLHGALGFGQTTPSPQLLPRIKVESGDPAWLFRRLCDGAMDGWRLVDEGLTGLQKPARPA